KPHQDEDGQPCADECGGGADDRVPAGKAHRRPASARSRAAAGSCVLLSHLSSLGDRRGQAGGEVPAAACRPLCSLCWWPRPAAVLPPIRRQASHALDHHPLRKCYSTYGNRFTNKWLSTRQSITLSNGPDALSMNDITSGIHSGR